MLSRYRGKTNAILVKKAFAHWSLLCKNKLKTVSDLVDLPIKHLVTFFEHLELDVYEKQIAHHACVEIEWVSFFDRSGFRLSDFKRNSSTLSGDPNR
jgi:excinuclease ABC subunit A